MKLITTGYPNFASISTINDTIQKPRLLCSTEYNCCNYSLHTTYPIRNNIFQQYPLKDLLNHFLLIEHAHDQDCYKIHTAAV